ncbi:hypothetical protein C8Q79DRAFT_1006826 [Trametes meyenii]|nr:hypothetical protein C8Q79DRAFT_1006826 [Trametes meyenii]
MFTRAFTRNFLFRRGSSSETSTARSQHKYKSRSRSRSAEPEPESRHAKNILQPSSQNVAASDQHAASVENKDKELKPKVSSQNLLGHDAEQDENRPVATEAPTAPPGHADYPLDSSDHAKGDPTPNAAVREVSGSFILVDNSAVEIAPQDTEGPGEEEMFQTPYLDTEEAMPPAPAAIVDQQTLDSPVAHPLFQTSCPPCALPVYEDGSSPSQRIPSPQPVQSSFDEGPCIVSLQTAILSDITEAEEPSPEPEVPGPTVDDAMSEADTESRYTVLSFDSFGSSYASTECPKASSPPSGPEKVSSTSAVLDDATQETGLEVESPSSTGHMDVSRDCDTLQRTPPISMVSMSLTSTSDVGVIRHPPAALAAQSSGSRLVCASVLSTSEFAPTCVSEALDAIPALSDQASISIPECQDKANSVPTGVEFDTPDIPTAITYADAMNLALKHPDMSSKILNEPLVSSACHSPVRTTSPTRNSAVSFKEAGHPGPPPPPDAVLDARLKRPAPAHTAERPNWALAPDEPKPARKPRSCGSTKSTPTRGDNREERRRNQAPARVGKAKAMPSVTSSPSVEPSGMEASVVQPAPKKCPAPEETSPNRDLRKEKAEPWIRRVGSWIAETSKMPQVCPNTAGMCPNAGKVPVVSSATSQSSSSAASTSNQASDAAKEAAAPIPRSTTTLNPHAVAWEPRQRAATVAGVAGTLSTTTNAPAGGAFVTRTDIASQFQRPVAIRDGSLESRGNIRTELRNPRRERSASNTSKSPQMGIDAGTSQNGSQGGLPPFVVSAVASGSTMARQRTQTHASFSQQVLWSPKELQAQPPQPERRVRPPTDPPTPPTLPLAEPTILYLATPVSGPSQLQFASETALNSPPYRPGGPESSYTVRLPSPGPSGAEPSRPVPVSRPPVTIRLTAPPGFLSRVTQAAFPPTQPNQQPGSAPYTTLPDIASPPVPGPAPPGSGRPPVPPLATAAPRSQTARFYGIETPQVVFDKHGWTVNN